MNRFPWSLLVAALWMLSVTGCHNTAQGVKADTRNALDKTGHELQKAGDKVDRNAKRDDDP
jgi:predicted small secreted protein